jgi:hypothetical protein
MLNKNFTFTKRTLGILCVAIGILGTIAIFAIDIIDVGREGGIGPIQTIGLVLMVGLFVLGITLIPLGDDPA